MHANNDDKYLELEYVVLHFSIENIYIIKKQKIIVYYLKLHYIWTELIYKGFQKLLTSIESKTRDE